ncbi:MAG: hypothetical protein ACQEQ0_12085 [Bacteroidota bacterium]
MALKIFCKEKKFTNKVYKNIEQLVPPYVHSPHSPPREGDVEIELKYKQEIGKRSSHLRTKTFFEKILQPAKVKRRKKINLHHRTDPKSARMVELVDTLDLKSSGHCGCAGLPGGLYTRTFVFFKIQFYI